MRRKIFIIITLNFFEEKEENGELGINLKDGKDIRELTLKFRGYLPFDLLKAFVDERSINAMSS